MHKSALFLPLFFLGAINDLPAQQGEPVLLNVFYQTIHVNDTNNRDKPQVENMLLQVSQTGSRYARASSKDAAKRVEKGSGMPTIVVTGKPLAVVNGPGITDVELFQHPAEGKMNITATLGMQDYIMELTLPETDWKISEETRKIGGYKCQQATCVFGGRLYTAWFTPELPFRNGPWKLSGLPGLILEVEDSKKEVSFLFKGINKDTAGALTASARRRMVKVSEQAFARAKEAFDQNPAAAMQSQLPPGTPTVQVAYRDGTGNTILGSDAQRLIDKKKETKAGNNNPIELIKK